MCAYPDRRDLNEYVDSSTLSTALVVNDCYPSIPIIQSLPLDGPSQVHPKGIHIELQGDDWG